mgnify:CR=1 FL=1
MSLRQDKINELLRELSAEFLERESNQTSLITVTRASISPDLKRATVFITVLPESREDFALDFAKRKRKELREYIRDRSKFRILPFLDVDLDRSEKALQKLRTLEQGGNPLD